MNHGEEQESADNGPEGTEPFTGAVACLLRSIKINDNRDIVKMMTAILAERIGLDRTFLHLLPGMIRTVARSEARRIRLYAVIMLSCISGTYL